MTEINLQTRKIIYNGKELFTLTSRFFDLNELKENKLYKCKLIQFKEIDTVYGKGIVLTYLYNDNYSISKIYNIEKTNNEFRDFCKFYNIKDTNDINKLIEKEFNMEFVLQTNKDIDNYQYIGCKFKSENNLINANKIKCPNCKQDILQNEFREHINKCM